MPSLKYYQGGKWHEVGFGAASGAPGASMYHNPNAGGLIAPGGSLAFDFGQAPDGAPNGGGSQLFYFVGGDYTNAYALKTGIYTVKVQITPGVYDVVPGFLVNTDNRYTEEHNKYARTYTEMGFNHDDVLGTGFVPLDIPGAENFISGGHTETYKIFADDYIQAGMQNLGDYPHIFNAQIEISVVYTDEGAEPSSPQFDIKVFLDSADVVVGDAAFVFMVPSDVAGLSLTSATAYVTTVSSSGVPEIQIRNVTTGHDMLSTPITIDASEYTSYTAATPPVVNSSYKQVSAGDLLAIDVDVAGTGAKGLGVVLNFA